MIHSFTSFFKKLLFIIKIKFIFFRKDKLNSGLCKEKKYQIKPAANKEAQDMVI